MNLDKWDSLSEEQQKAIQTATAEFERYMVDYHTEAEKKEREVLAEAGIEFITLPDEDVKEMTDKAYDVEWDYLTSEIPDEVENLRKLSE
jgi:TRAP-type C4-dicarboxylate transport system substrate-binding protein